MTRRQFDGARLLALALAPWVLAVACVVLARACVPADAPWPGEAMCSTDTDCAERIGGDGGPAPADLEA